MAKLLILSSHPVPSSPFLASPLLSCPYLSPSPFKRPPPPPLLSPVPQYAITTAHCLLVSEIAFNSPPAASPQNHLPSVSTTAIALSGNLPFIAVNSTLLII